MIKTVINMFWKFYSIAIMFCLYSAAEGNNEIWPGNFNVYLKIVGIAIYFIAVFGLFAYAYNDKLLKPVFWKIFLFIFLFWEFMAKMFLLPPMEQGISMFDWSVWVLFALPSYYAIYINGFQS